MKTTHLAALVSIVYAAGLITGFGSAQEKTPKPKKSKTDDTKYRAARNKAIENIFLRKQIGDLRLASDTELTEAFNAELDFQLVVENSM